MIVNAWLKTEWILTRPCLNQPWPTTVTTDASLSHLGDLIIYHIIHNSTMVITWLSERIGPSLQPTSVTLTEPQFDDSRNLHYFLAFHRLFELLYLFLPIIVLTLISLMVIYFKMMTMMREIYLKMMRKRTRDTCLLGKVFVRNTEWQ